MKQSRTFRRFLRLREPLWVALLDAIEALRGKPVTEQHEQDWDKTLGPGGIHRYKDELNMHLEQCTKGNARRIVATCGGRNALGASFPTVGAPCGPKTSTTF